MTRIVTMLALLGCLLVGGVFAHGDAAAATGAVTVSLTFDDGTADQYQARSILAGHGMRGTFYVNSARLGLSGYMTQSQLQGLAADGNEIAGHTLSHADLPTLAPDEQQRQVCGDRVNLLNMGFSVYDFAYPYGDFDSGTEGVAQNCGYNSARALGGIVSPGTCHGCDYAETMPPQAFYAIRTPDSIKSYNTLSDLQTYVTQAEQHGGGWVPLAFHHLCSGAGCDTLSADPALLSSFLDWLQGRGVPVKTVHEVMGGALQPPVTPPAPPFNDGVLQNGSLETPVSGTAPDCWKLGGSGTSTATGTRTSDAHTGSWGYRIDASSVTSGSDKKLYSTQDLGTCAPGAAPGDVFQLSAWYKTNAQARLVAYYRTTAGAWVFWAQQGANLPAASDWAQASWQLPAVPNGATGISVAMSIRSAGYVTVDDFALQTGDTVPPSVSVGSPADGATVSGNVTLSANASDNVGVTKVDFFVAGALVGSATGAPWQVTWDSGTAQHSDLGITARAYDAAGNSTTSAGVNVTVAAPPPSGTGLIQNRSLETPATGVPDCWQLGSSGTNTATWARTTDAHTGSLAENVRITAYTSGDRKLVVKQDSGACSPSVGSGATYQLSGWYKSDAPTQFVVFTRNASTGAWAFWTQSPTFAAAGAYTQAKWTTPPVPAGVSSLSFGLSLARVGSLTVDDFDLAPTDTQAPTVGVTSPTAGATLKGAVSLTASAYDNVGVTKVAFYVDGGLIGTTTTAPYTLGWDSTSVGDGPHTFAVRAYDATGNTAVSTAAAATVKNVDTTPPSVALTSPAAGSSVFGQLLLSANASDEVAVNRVEFYAGARLIASVGTAPYEALWNSGDAANGPLTITAKAYDMAGNVASDSAAVTVANPDTTPPTVSLTNPADGATVGGTVGLDASAADDEALDRVEFLVDGTVVATATAAPWQTTWTTTAADNGPHTLTARAYDAAGNSASSIPRTVTVANQPPPDTTPPTVSLTAPADGATISGIVSLDASADDDRGVARVEFLVDGTVVGSATAAPWQANWVTSAVDNGDHAVTARAYDAAGNTSDSNRLRVTVANEPPPDTTPPSLVLTAPSAGSSVSGELLLAASASDDVAVDHVEFYAGTELVAAVGAAPYEALWSTADVPDGPLTITAKAYDTAGNLATDSVTVTVAQPDTTPPTVTLTSPADGATLSGTVSLEASADDDGGVAKVEFLVDGAVVGSADAAPWQGTWTTTPADNGDHTVTARAYDTAGNGIDSAAATVTVANPVPDTTPPVTTAGCGSACDGWFSSAVHLTLTATDAEGSGVASTRYTLDGSTPTETNGTPYTGLPVELAQTTTVRFRSWDNAGNAEPVQTQLIRIDTAAPTAAAGCNGAGCGGWYRQPVQLSLDASDTGGSGVDRILYTTDGSTPTTTHGTVYGGPLTVGATTTVDFVAVDVAGNVGPVVRQTVQVDTAAPTVSITSPAPNATVTKTVQVKATAADGGGSGMASVAFWLDGVLQTTVSGAGPYQWSWNTGKATKGQHTITVVARDNAGNTTSASQSVTVA